MRKMLVGLLFALTAATAWALPTEQEVQKAVADGNFTQAQSMMADVVAAKPNSAKAHYVYAEILAHNAAFNKAAEETAKAKQIDPKIGFTDPAKFQSFESMLQREQNAATNRAPRAAPTSMTTAPTYNTASSGGGGIPGWIWLVGLAILGVVLWKGFTRSRAAGGAVPPAGYGPGGQGYGPGGPGAPGYGPGGPGYGPGGPGYAPGVQPRSGMLGTGLAVAGGVAGGMLLDEVLHRGDRSGGGGGGGLIPDAYANPAASDLENRSIDFGSGNDWDSGGGGGVDLGGGGGGGDGGSWD